MAINRTESILENRFSAARDLNTPMSCVRCGSTYFEETKLYQFSALSYGSNEYKLLSSQGKNVLKCPCGYIVIPQARHVAGSATVRGAAEAFNTSTVAAKNYLDKLTPESFAKIAASPTELEALRTQLIGTITEISDQFKAELEKLKATPEAESKPKTKK